MSNNRFEGEILAQRADGSITLDLHHSVGPVPLTIDEPIQIMHELDAILHPWGEPGHAPDKPGTYWAQVREDDDEPWGEQLPVEMQQQTFTRDGRDEGRTITRDLWIDDALPDPLIGSMNCRLRIRWTWRGPL